MKTVFNKIIKLANSKGFFIFILLLSVAIYGTKSDRYFGWTNIHSKDGEPVLTDGSGYYAYLPQWFIYKNNHFQFTDSINAKYPTSRFGDFNRVKVKGQAANKYYVGPAICMTPFFGIAHIHAKIAGADQDGYSWPYLMWVNFSAIAFYLIGAIGFLKFFRRFEIQRFWILLGILGIAFGTNLSYYTNVMVPFAHVYSFAVVSWMLYFSKKWIDLNDRKSFVLFCILIGLAFIIRPTNVLALLFIFFLFPSTKSLLERLKLLFVKQKILLLFGFSLVIGCVLFQMYSNYLQTGVWQINSYTAEGFDNWRNPPIGKVLFSWGKGLFIYAPILFLVFPGLFLLAKKNRRLFIGWLIFATLFTYVTASWWCWWYGGGLGARQFIDMLLIWMLPIIWLFNYAKTFVKVIAICWVVLTTWMYQVYEFQMRNNILHYDTMTYPQFKSVFMKEDLRYGWALHLRYDTLPAKKEFVSFPFVFKSINGKDLPATSQNRFDVLNENDNPFLIVHKSELSKIDQNKKIGFKLQLDLKIITPETNPTFLVKTFKNKVLNFENNYFMGLKIDEVGNWTSVQLDIDPKLKANEIDSIAIQFTEGNTIVYARNFKAKMFTY